MIDNGCTVIESEAHDLHFIYKDPIYALEQDHSSFSRSLHSFNRQAINLTKE